jgi:hypothetical protein
MGKQKPSAPVCRIFFVCKELQVLPGRLVLVFRGLRLLRMYLDGWCKGFSSGRCSGYGRKAITKNQQKSNQETERTLA